jgi:hypothetical protein
MTNPALTRLVLRALSLATVAAPLLAQPSVSSADSSHRAGKSAATVDTTGATSGPCARDADARRFDFWVGEWNVRNTRGAAVGESRIERVSGGCAILENWTSAKGVVGKSLNFFNRDVGQWQQYWVGAQGDQTLYVTSEWHGPTLTFHARATLPGGKRVLRRLSFTPVASDTVRQLGEISSDSGRTWTTEYDLYYGRKP